MRKKKSCIDTHTRMSKASYTQSIYRTCCHGSNVNHLVWTQKAEQRETVALNRNPGDELCALLVMPVFIHTDF